MAQQLNLELLKQIDSHALGILDQRRIEYYTLKRILDLILSTAALIFLAPVMAVIGLFIALDSPGPVFYVQQRVGAKRRAAGRYSYWQETCFACHKFRTMYDHADPTLHQAHVQAYIQGNLKEGNCKDHSYKLARDPRVTRVGGLLRKTSLDELPQLINVIRGEMSLVGPRPLPKYEVDQYQPWHRERLAALPGITGLWQVKGRCKVTFEEQVRMDIDYVRKQNLWLDLQILFLTIPAVFSRRGAG